jgi:hypothetical protein
MAPAAKLARSMADFVGISKVLEDKKVTLRVLAMGLDMAPQPAG